MGRKEGGVRVRHNEANSNIASARRGSLYVPNEDLLTSKEVKVREIAIMGVGPAFFDMHCVQS